MKLFSVGKVGVFLTKIDHNTERRRDGEVQILVLSCRIHPFDHKLAQSMDDLVRGSLFQRSGNADPHGHVRSLGFVLPLDRQNIDLYASTDTVKPSIRFEQVRISSLSAKLEKGSNGYVCTFKMSFGPVDKNELAYCHAWRTTQRFITFEESEPDLAYELVGQSREEDDDNDDAQPALEMEPEEALAAAGVGASTDRQQHKAITHRKKSKKR